MIAYLTSHIGGSYKVDGKRISTYLCADNGLIDSIKKRWLKNSKVLIISADADSIERNDGIRDAFQVAFPMSGFSLKEIVICDRGK